MEIVGLGHGIENLAETRIEPAPLHSDWKPVPQLSSLGLLKSRVPPKLTFLMSFFAVWFLLCVAAFSVLGRFVNLLFSLINSVHALGLAFAARPGIRLQRKEFRLDSRDEYHACVEAVYLFEGHCVGQDHGVLVVADGWLNFEGQRSRFSLKPSDATEKIHVPRDGDCRLVGAASPFEVTLHRLRQQNGPMVASAAAMCSGWSGGTSPAGLSVYPPASPDSTQLRYLALFTRAQLMCAGFWVLMSCAGTALLRARLRESDQEAAWCCLLIGALFGAMCMMGAWISMRDRRALLRLQQDQSP
jgi:hypothetical protein